MIELFEIENGVVKPTVHCTMIKWLNVIQQKWPDNATKIYAYVFYMTCPNYRNPYFNVNPEIREDMIVKDIEIDFSLEEEEIFQALAKAEKLYSTATVRAHRAITIMLDNMSDYMETAKITAGRDGNITALIRLAKDFNSIRQSYKDIAKDLQEEQQLSVRGSQELAYDQRL